MSIQSGLRINCSQSLAVIGKLTLPCRIGRAGFVSEKDGCEGDEKTPLGVYSLRWGFYRADRLPRPKVNPDNPLTWRALNREDGWCDAENHPAYNRFIKLPSRASHETLWREDGAYDIILVISHNDSPPIHGAGSAVFIHIAQADDRKTLGCIAFAPEDMVKLLPKLTPDMVIDIRA